MWLLATGYGLNGPEIEFWWGRNFKRPPRDPPSLLHNAYLVFSGVKAAGTWCRLPTAFYHRCLRRGWACTSASPLYVHRHVMGWPLPLLCRYKVLSLILTALLFKYSFIRIQPWRPGLAGTRAQSCDRYSSDTLHPGQVLGGSLPLLSPAFRRSHFSRQVPPSATTREILDSSEGRRAEDFFRPKNPTASAGFEPANLGTKGQHATPRSPKSGI